jgi:hypothetical protein
MNESVHAKMTADNIIVTDISMVSDMRLKKNIVKIPDAYKNTLKISGKKYQWNTNEKWDIGLIAQDVENIFPELVQTDDKGYKSVMYQKFVPLLIEGLKEQDKEIQFLKYGLYTLFTLNCGYLLYKLF